MPIRDVEFLQMPASLSSGEYPLLTSATQSLAGYRKASMSCKIKDDLRQSIKVPTFTGWADCNMIRANGMLYWILEAHTATDSESSVEFVISYCGPSSVLHKSDSVVGTFERLPTNRCAYLQRQAVTSALEHTRSVELPRIPDSGDSSVYWLQVTGLKSDGTYRRLGYFVKYNGDGDISGQVTCERVIETGTQYYPSLKMIITKPETYTGLTASQIIDISISCRCPWEVYVNGEERMLKGVVTDWIQPTEAFTGITYGYDLDAMFVTESYAPVPYTTSVSLTLSDLERASGTVTIRDEKAASIGIVPTAYGSSITATISMLSDWTGIVTYVDYGGYRVSIPEGHIPWSGTAWAEYRAYSMAYDRSAMEQSIAYSNERVATQLAQSAASTIQSSAMGFIGGDAVGGAAGVVGGVTSYAISAWATLKESDISTREARSTQALAERRVAGQPATPYNAGYGMIYCQQCRISPASLWVELPAGLTSSIDADYTACFGFPAEGLRSIIVQEGYIKGRIYESTLARGPKFDRMNEALQNGILFKEV